ncbi:NUDIX hydrolase [Actinomadura barringtoniae]|uniref:NUDIX hydrolase n=1 Tax=Actinomadura barringtoniae TaxID=1427535 RepID=A0A939TDS6_9ACTN|nr:NUDIX hydrolase [Actinomadura barringtoniae]
MKVLEAYRPSGTDAGFAAAQARLREEFLGHLNAHADGLWKACAPGHITASALVLDSTGTQVLLTLHRKIKMWLQLGGHCEPGDATLAEAALREATEESGIEDLELRLDPIQLDRHKVFCHPEGTWHLDVQYVAYAPQNARAEISDESDDLRWFPANALPDLTDDAVRRLVARATTL